MYELLESSIDSGARPNAKTVALHTHVFGDEVGLTRLKNLGLYAVGNYEYEWVLLARVEMGANSTAIRLPLVSTKELV